MKIKILTSVLSGLLLLSILTTAANALVYPSTFYNNRASSYSYAGSATPIYNCMAYALGITNQWVWPWGSNEPTLSQVDGVMSLYYGYSPTSVFQGDIIVYGSTSRITHFGKATGFNTSKAKWGQLELFSHNSRDPYPNLNAGTDSWGSYGYGDAVSGYSN